jgi:hypothetical protein
MSNSSGMTGAQSRAFLDHLAETANVTASAKAAEISPSLAYRMRRERPAFRAAWEAALAEGYARLEAFLVSQALVQANSHTSETTIKSRAQKYRLGLSLLSLHRAAVRGEAKLAPPPKTKVNPSQARAALAAKLDGLVNNPLT